MDPAGFVESYRLLRDALRRVIVGQDPLLDEVLVAMFAGGHVLLEGVPGVGKTLLVRTIARALELRFSRIQFTPDLMPADIIGTNIVMQDDSGRRYFEFQRGPIFAQIILADEINRATPKTQSALLEAMQERSVTSLGVQRQLEEPYVVLATQNPIEMEGTYPLPEAQLDRFLFKLRVPFPGEADLVEVIERTTGPEMPTVPRIAGAAEVVAMQRLARDVPAPSTVKSYAARVVLATHPDRPASATMARRFVRYGGSPRAAQALVLAGKVRALAAGRLNVSFEDVRAVAVPAMRHRVILNFEGEAEGIDTDRVIANAIEEVPELPAVPAGA